MPSPRQQPPRADFSLGDALEPVCTGAKAGQLGVGKHDHVPPKLWVMGDLSMSLVDHAPKPGRDLHHPLPRDLRGDAPLAL